MALFSDGKICTAEDLRAYESTILDVANSEGIGLDRKFAVASAELGTQLSEYLINNSRWPGYGPVSLPTYARDTSRVVVTDALKQWYIAHTLALVYRDAYSSQMNDRYAKKWDEYRVLAVEARTRLFQIGVGMSSDPVPAADLPQCGAANGGVLPACNYVVQVDWESAGGREGSLSEPVEFGTAAGQLLTVTGVDAPTIAAGWNVYVGVAGNSVTKQNARSLSPGDVWMMPVGGLGDGPPPSREPGPDYYVPRSRMFRG